MTQEQMDDLNRRFSLSGLTFEDSGSGPVAKIHNPLCTAAVSLHGAHVLSWIPAGEREVIFTSRTAIFKEGTPVRGGIPVCWPWFNAHPTDTEAYSHGFARRVPWELDTAAIDNDATTLSFTLRGNAGDYPHWPHAFAAKLTVRAGAVLSVSLETHNRGNAPFTVSQALHTYFAVGDVEQISVTGLSGCRYHDDVDGGDQNTQSGSIRFKGEVDRVYLDRGNLRHRRSDDEAPYPY